MVERLAMSLTLFCTSSSVTSTAVQCSSSRGRGFEPSSVTHEWSYTRIQVIREMVFYKKSSRGRNCYSSQVTLISGTAILVSGFLSSIRSMSSFRSLLIRGLRAKLQFYEFTRC